EAHELKNIVTPALLLQSGLLQGSEYWPSPSLLYKDRANRAKKQGIAAWAAEKRPRQEDDGLLAELEKKRRGLETSIHDITGGTVLPPFDLDPPPRLPLEIE
ncbi:unnamed protein product, partial [Prunus brigantina]